MSLYVIHATHSYARGIINAPKDGFLRDPDSGLIVVYTTREEAEAWVQENSTGIYHLNHGEHGRPLYRARAAHPTMRTMLGVAGEVAEQQVLVMRATKTAEAIRGWDREDIHMLKLLLTQHAAACERARLDFDHGIDMSDLPSEPFPVGTDTFHVWALDKRGMALVGEAADCIEPLSP